MIGHRKSLAVALGFVLSTAALADSPKPVGYVSNQDATRLDPSAVLWGVVIDDRSGNPA